MVKATSVTNDRYEVRSIGKDQDLPLLQRNFAGTCVEPSCQRAYIVGGKAGKYFNDVIMIELGNLANKTPTIQVLQPVSGSPLPTPRYGHTYEQDDEEEI